MVIARRRLLSWALLQCYLWSVRWHRFGAPHWGRDLAAAEALATIRDAGSEPLTPSC